MIRWRSAVAAFVASMALQVGAQAAGDDFRQTKEWKALNRCVGVWEDQVTVTVPQLKQSRGLNTVAWTLGDRFLQMKCMEDGTESMFLWTYDANRRAVRCWMFSFREGQAVFTGGWDEAARTFTLKAEDAGPMSVIVTEHVIDDDHHEWKVITKDVDGKVVYESSGKRTRQRKLAEKPAPDGFVQPAGDDLKQTKEWKALNRYVGSWDNQVTVTVPEIKQSRQTPTAAWTLGDRFLQMKEKSEDGTELMCLFAYDQNRRAVRWWWFDSRGGAGVATGSWDEATSTFSFKTEDTGPMSGALTDRFIDDDHREWKWVLKDPDGKVVNEMSGKVTRQRKGAEQPGPGRGGVARDSRSAPATAPKTAAETVKRFIELLRTGDVDAAAKYVNAPDPDAGAGLKRAADRLKSDQRAVTLADSKEDGDLAVVIVKVVDQDQGGDAGALYQPNAMMRGDGVWRIYPSVRKTVSVSTAVQGGAGGEKIEVAPKEKMDIRPSIGEPDMELEGAAKERMDVLWTWAQSRREKLNMDSQKVGGPNMPLAMDDFRLTKEWKALNRYVGSWDNQATVTIPAPSQSRSSGTAAWALGGRFLQGKSKGDDNSESMNLFTYDPNRRAVRVWWFSSLGYTSVSTGGWDEATSTFTFKADDSAPMTVIMTDHFIDDDHREYKVTTQDVDGKVVFQMSAKSTRQKK